MEDTQWPKRPTEGARTVPPTLKERGAVQRIVDQLLDDLAPERVLKRAERAPASVESYRTPNGCVLQSPTSALSVSWFPDAGEEAPLGELHIVLWNGVVTRRGSLRPTTGAVVIREMALRPNEQPVDDAVWITSDGTTFERAALSAYCLAMLDTHDTEQGAGEG